MKQRQGLLLAGAAVAVILLALAFLWWPRGGTGTEPARGEQLSTGVDSGGEAPGRTATLYFPGNGRFLAAEERIIPDAGELRGTVKAIVGELLAGPRQPGLHGPLPPEVVVAGVYLGPGGVVYVDLQSPEGGAPPAAGSMQEMLTVYSLVNSIAANAEGVRRVVLLWNGNQLPSFSGHLGSARPLAPDPSLLAEAP